MRVLVIGKGAFGTAISTLLNQNKQEIYFWKSKMKIDFFDVILVAVPTQAIRKVLQTFKKPLKETIFINCAKGIEQNTHKLPFEIVKELFGEEINYYTLIGPSFAVEVNDKMPTLVNLGSFVKDRNHARNIANIFQTDYFRIRMTQSVEILELAAAFKNVYAISSGIAEGLGFAMNTRAKLITIAHEEFSKLSKKLNFKSDENANIGILGDLILTCNSSESRNFRFGKLLTKYQVYDCLRLANGTVEGLYTVSSIPYFLKKTNIKLPLAEFVFKVIEHDQPEKVKKLFMELVKKI